jgi:uncharacterized protein YoxC
MSKKGIIEVEFADGKKAGETLKELTQMANRLNKEIGDLKPGSEEFVKRTNDFQKVTGRLKEVRSEVKGVEAAQKGLVSSFSQLIPFGGQIQAITGKFAGFRTGIGGVTKGFGGLKTAIISTGIGALVVLIGSLVSWLSKTQRGMELLQKATAAVGAVFDVIIDRASMLIDGLKSMFSGDITGGMKTLKNSISQIGSEMLKETKLAWELKEAMIALGKAETDFTLIQAQRKRQIQELIFLTRDETVSYEEKREALIKANELELANMEDSLRLQREKVKLMELEYDRAESTEEQRAALIAERVKLEELETSSLARQRELRNRMNELANKEKGEAKKRHDEKLKEIQEEAKAREEANKERIEAEKALMAELEQMEKDAQKELADDLKGVADLRKQNNEDRLLDLDFYIENERIKIDEAFADRLINEEERQEMLFQLEVERLQKQLELVRAYYGDESNEAKGAILALNQFMSGARVEDTKSAIASEDEKGDAFLRRASESLGAAKWLQGNLSQLYEEGSKEAKSLAIFEAELSAIQAALAAFAQGNKIGGPILGGIWAAIAFAFGQVQIAKMNSVQKAERGMVIDSINHAVSYASGGLLRGRRHSQGGIPGYISSGGQRIPIEMEDGEIILNRNVGLDPAGLQMASNLNAMYGGVRFMEAGGPVNPFSKPSVSGTTQSVSMGTSGNGDVVKSLETLNNNFIALSNKVDNWQRNLRVFNNVQDTREGLNVINRLEQDAGF